MPLAARARVENVISKIAADLMRDAKRGAGNRTLSKVEAANSDSQLIKDGDARVRLAGGAGTRVKATEAASSAIGIVRATIGEVNTRGPSTLSQAEIKALMPLNEEVARRAAKAYELMTGKPVDLGE